MSETTADDGAAADTRELTGDLPDSMFGSPASEDEIDELDADFAPQPRHRLGKLSALLAALLVAGLGFLGGVQVQKHTGNSQASGFTGFGGASGAAGAATARRGAGAAGFAGGAGGGFTRGGGAGATGGAGAAAGGGAATGSGAAGGAASSLPAVIGTVVSVNGTTVVVKNLGGQQITVHLSAATTLTAPVSASGLKAGQSVTVSGTTGTDGSVTASTIKTQ